MAQYDSKADFKVHEMKSMGKSRDSEAMEILKRISHQVQPIMRRREWRVPLLSEFFPANPNLLGLNIGGGRGRTREIKVRLRPARDPDSFLPYESVLGTMLHELVHNVRGPHDSIFYKLLDEITAECEELMARGIGGTGVGFDGPSCGRLGSHAFIPIHNPAPGRLRDCALKAAEERAKRQRIMPSGPCRLGGGEASAGRYATPAAAAAAAADRRCRDNRWCPCERLAGAVNRAVAQAEAQRAAAQQQGQQGGTGATVAAAGNTTAGNTQGGATESAAPAAGPSNGADTGRLQQGPTAEEVEADLVRRIEEGVIDLTLDSDDSDSDSAGDVAVPDLQAVVGAGSSRRRPTGRSLGPHAAAVASSSSAAVNLGGAPSEAPDRGISAALPQGYMRVGIRPGVSAAGFRSAPMDTDAGDRSGLRSSSVQQYVAAQRQAVQGESDLDAEAAERLPPSHRAGAGGSRNGSGPSGTSGSADGVGLFTSGRRGHKQAGKLAAPDQQRATAERPAASAGPSGPTPRPPLQVLQPRNPAAAAAAAAALSRIQSQQRQMPQAHEAQAIHRPAVQRYGEQQQLQPPNTQLQDRLLQQQQQQQQQQQGGGRPLKQQQLLLQGRPTSLGNMPALAGGVDGGLAGGRVSDGAGGGDDSDVIDLTGD